MTNVMNMSVRECNVLWTGDTSVETYPAQNLTLNLAGYTLLMIACRGRINSNTTCNIVVNDSAIYTPQLVRANFGSSAIPYRYVTITSTGLSFSNEFTGTTGEEHVSNNNVIPYVIYGIR